MKRHLFSAVYFVGLASFCSFPAVAGGKDKPLQISCSVIKGDCWETLAQAVIKNPTTNHFDMTSSEETGGYAVANSVMDTKREYRWFYNRKKGIVDYKARYWEPPEDWGKIRQRSSYLGVTPHFWSLLSGLNPSITDNSFDLFATKNGIRVSKYVIDPYPLKQGIN